MKITLPWPDINLAAQVGVRRRIASRMQGMKDAYGMDEHSADLKWFREILGACGEMAFAKMTNQYWPAGVNQDKHEADVGGDWQVRTSSSDYGLIVRPNDPDYFRYAYVIGVIPDFEFVGWLFGGEAKQACWLKDPGNRGSPAYFIPRKELHEPDTGH